MSPSRKNDLIVGIFVLIALGVLFAMTYLIQGSTGRNPYVINTVFPDVAGLEIGSPVLVSGFRIGRVIRMEARPNEEGINEVLVVSRVARDIPIYRDAEVRLVQQGFIGDKRLEIRPGSPAAGEIQEGDLLRSVPQGDLGQVIAQGTEMLEEFRVIVRNIGDITGDQDRLANIDRTIRNISDATAELHALLRENREAVAASTDNLREVTAQLRQTSSRADRIGEQVEETLTELQGVLSDVRSDRERLVKQFDSILTNADATAANANRLLASAADDYDALSDALQRSLDTIAEIVARINRGEGTAGRLLTDSRVIDELETSISSFRSTFIREQDTLFPRDLTIRPAPAAAP